MAESPSEPSGIRIKSTNCSGSVDLVLVDDDNLPPQLLIPIVGYEVMEERARFTVFKLRIENMSSGDMWFVYRRYTDFFRLFSKLKSMFPTVKLSLPRKRWFGDNFDPTFLDDRVIGLQRFIDTILGKEELMKAQCTRDFFCLDDPPSYSDSIEETRATLDAMEDTLFQLKHQLKERDLYIDRLKEEISIESRHRSHLFTLVQEAILGCPQCSKEFSRLSILGNSQGRESSPDGTVASNMMELVNLGS